MRSLPGADGWKDYLFFNTFESPTNAWIEENANF